MKTFTFSVFPPQGAVDRARVVAESYNTQWTSVGTSVGTQVVFMDNLGKMVFQALVPETFAYSVALDTIAQRPGY